MINFDFENKKTLADALIQLYSVLEVLRGPNGCPWDKEQSNKDIAKNLLEETYEYIEAVTDNDKESIEEELGDIFLNAMMLLEIHDEDDSVDTIKSINGVAAKLIRRHPHVFSDQIADNSGDVLRLWDSIKVNVEGKKESKDDFFSRVPKILPPLDAAYEIQKKMAKVGFDWSEIGGVLEKIDEEKQELIEAIKNQNKDNIEEEIGDLLFSIVNVARFLKINPSVALNRTNNKVKERFNSVVSLSKKQNISVAKENVERLNAIWEELKKS